MLAASHRQAGSSLRCGVLAAFDFDWATALVLATPDIDFYAFDAGALGVPESPNPFALPRSDSVDVVVVSSTWYYWLLDRRPDHIERVLDRIEHRATVVGLDSGDEFGLAFPPAMFDRFALVLKPQGLYRDRDLYNYRVGATAPGANWTGRTRARNERYSASQLAKLRLSVPCILLDFPAIRRAARVREVRAAPTLDRRMSSRELVLRRAADAALGLMTTRAPLRHRPLEVHCLVQLSHVQRIEAIQLLSGFTGIRGITHVRETVQGTADGWNLSPETRARIAAEAAPLMRPSVARWKFMYQLCRHRIGVAPTGFGELGQRHAAVMLSGAALVCQDLSHVEMMFPIDDSRNAVFCRPDLSDLRDVVRELLADDERRLSIASRGRASLRQWMGDVERHLRLGVGDHLRSAAAATSAGSDARRSGPARGRQSGTSPA